MVRLNVQNLRLFCHFGCFSFLLFSFLLFCFLLFSSLLFSALLCSSLLFSSLLFSFHVCFSSVHIVGSLTSRLPWGDLHHLHRFRHVGGQLSSNPYKTPTISITFFSSGGRGGQALPGDVDRKRPSPHMCLQENQFQTQTRSICQQLHCPHQMRRATMVIFGCRKEHAVAEWFGMKGGC